jgi:hypothetical protein
MNNFTKIFFINNNNFKYDYTKTNEYEFNEYKFNIYNLEEKIGEILEEKTKVLIYFEGIDNTNLKKIINILDQHKNFKLFNVTIFNKITNADLAIPLFFTKSNIKTYKKILNIFPFDIAITVCSETTFELLKLVNKSIDVVINNNEPKDKCYTIWYQTNMKGGFKNINQQRFVFRLMETKYSEILDQTWWFKYYFNIPVCAYGRISQSTGTCWCNVILNICFLTPGISTLLIEKFNNLDSEYKKYINEKYKEINDINNCNDKLKNIIFGIINIILINKKKATTLDGNFISEIAARIKGIAQNNDEFYYKNLDEKLQYGDIFNPLVGFYIFLDTILIKNIDYMHLELYGFGDLTQKYDFLSSIPNGLERDKVIDDINKINDLFDFTLNLIDKFPDPNKNISIKLSDIIYNLEQINITNLPNIIIVPVIGKCTKEIIYINDTEYKLQSSVINYRIETTNDFHSVSGLNCNEKYYIYDSNDIISYTKWNNGIYNEYIDMLNDYYNQNNYNYDFYLFFCIYIKN